MSARAVLNKVHAPTGGQDEQREDGQAVAYEALTDELPVSSDRRLVDLVELVRSSAAGRRRRDRARGVLGLCRSYDVTPST